MSIRLLRLRDGVNFTDPGNRKLAHFVVHGKAEAIGLPRPACTEDCPAAIWDSRRCGWAPSIPAHNFKPTLAEVALQFEAWPAGTRALR